MVDYKKIKEEIIDSLVIKDKDITRKVQEELDFLESSDGLNDKNNLEDFYDRWQRRKGQVGNENKINSWAYYALGLTTKKPEEGSVFGKPRRAFTRPGPPDIDCDFDADRRDEIYEYAIKKYGGPEHVSLTGTYQSIKFRAAVTRIIKSLDLACAFQKGDKAFRSENMLKVNEILGCLPKSKADFIPVRTHGGKVEKAKTTADVIKYFEQFAWYATEKYPGVGKYAPEFEGLISSASCHPAALVISNEPLKEIAPLRKVKVKKGQDGPLATQFVYEELERMGLIKIDFLAISALTVIRECIKLIKQRYGIDIDIHKIPWDDKKTFDLYNSGKLLGVFQCEGDGMQQKIMEIGVDSFSDIMAIVALYRPGPMDYIPVYANRKKGLEKVSYPHPLLEKLLRPILDKTYGILVYQEQIILACKALAGFSMTNGYVLIKAVSKKKKDMIQRMRDKFIKGCIKNGIPEESACVYWDNTIVPFADYGFNAAHACCYAANSYLTAYLKANYTEEYMCSLLNVENIRRKYDKIERFEKDLKNFHIKLLPKNINECKADYAIKRKLDPNEGIVFSEIMPSLTVKNVGYEAASEIERNQPYKDLRDFAIKTSSSVDKEVVFGLCEGGFFDDYVKKYSKIKKEKMTPEKFTEMFANIRNDQKKAASKGVISENLFDNL